jgi:hypothetical protein
VRFICIAKEMTIDDKRAAIALSRRIQCTQDRPALILTPESPLIKERIANMAASVSGKIGGCRTHSRI